jgi:hypothetical protein
MRRRGGKERERGVTDGFVGLMHLDEEDVYLHILWEIERREERSPPTHLLIYSQIRLIFSVEGGS